MRAKAASKAKNSINAENFINSSLFPLKKKIQHAKIHHNQGIP